MVRENRNHPSAPTLTHRCQASPIIPRESFISRPHLDISKHMLCHSQRFVLSLAGERTASTHIHQPLCPRPREGLCERGVLQLT